MKRGNLLKENIDCFVPRNDIYCILKFSFILVNRCFLGKGNPCFCKNSNSIGIILYASPFSSMITLLHTVSSSFHHDGFSPLDKEGSGEICSNCPNSLLFTVTAPSGISTLIGSSLRKYHNFVTSSLVKLESIRYAAVSLK